MARVVDVDADAERGTDAHPAIRALQRLLAELLTASEPGAVAVGAAVGAAAYR